MNHHVLFAHKCISQSFSNVTACLDAGTLLNSGQFYCSCVSNMSLLLENVAENFSAQEMSVWKHLHEGP
jgi:hypothetical protein